MTPERLDWLTRPCGEPITPEMIDADPTLSDAQKAEVYDMLFEWHGDEDDAE